MTIQELPLRSRLLLGWVNRRNERRMIWSKVSDNNDFFCSGGRAGYERFDKEEYDNPSGARRRQGNNYYPHSNIHQWLNADADAVWTKKHEYDAVRWTEGERIHDGFLTMFDADEKRLLVEREITVVTPPGSIKTIGRAPTSLKALVTLPSASEISAYCNGEGDCMPALNDEIRNKGDLLTRTGIQDPSHVVVYDYGNSHPAPASHSFNIYPIIRLDPNAQVQRTDDEYYGNAYELITPGAFEAIEYLSQINDLICG